MVGVNNIWLNFALVMVFTNNIWLNLAVGMVITNDIWLNSTGYGCQKQYLVKFSSEYGCSQPISSSNLAANMVGANKTFG